MLQAGSVLGVTIQRRLFKNGLSLENQGGRGRKSSVPKIGL